MPAITRADTVSSGDGFVLYVESKGGYYYVSASDVLAWLQAGLTFPGKATVQYSAPAATGFTVLVTDGSSDIRLILTPLAGYADGAITLPALANCVDKQQVIVSCTQAVATFVVNGNGSTVVGAPTALVAGGYFTLQFDDGVDTWYRIG